ncbi:hypothetical protein KUCAC02_007058, partial [Chaenocephalus aceratus]
MMVKPLSQLIVGSLPKHSQWDGTFSVDVLLKSNQTGGLNTVDPTAERRRALDGKKLQALLDAVKNRFPGIKTSDLRKSINTRICELRHQ